MTMPASPAPARRRPLSSEAWSILLALGITALAELQRATHCWRQVVNRQQVLNSSLVQAIGDATLLRQPEFEPRYLVEAGDGSAGQLGELSIELWSNCLCYRTSSCGKIAIDVEAARIDAQVQQPQLLLLER